MGDCEKKSAKPFNLRGENYFTGTAEISLFHSLNLSHFKQKDNFSFEKGDDYTRFLLEKRV
jgi:hypothetical protein